MRPAAKPVVPAKIDFSPASLIWPSMRRSWLYFARPVESTCEEERLLAPGQRSGELGERTFRAARGTRLYLTNAEGHDEVCNGGAEVFLLVRLHYEV